MSRRHVEKTWIIIAGCLTIIVVGAWIGVEVHSRAVTDRITPQVEDVLQPLDPILNVAALDKIDKKTPIPINLEQPLESQIPKP